MKLTVFNGSPRGERGNTHAMVREFIEGAREAGAEVENVLLVEKRIAHCRGCFVCWGTTPGVCVIHDDMRELLTKVLESDIVVLATPLYVDNVTGLMKDFMDRLIPLMDPHLEKDDHGEIRHPRRGNGKGRKLVAISNNGFPEQSHFQVLRLLFRRVARNMSSELVGEIYRGAGELFGSKNPQVAALLTEYKGLLRKAGRELVESEKISAKTQAELEKSLIADDQYFANANRYWDRVAGTR